MMMSVSSIAGYGACAAEPSGAPVTVQYTYPTGETVWYARIVYCGSDPPEGPRPNVTRLKDPLLYTGRKNA